MSPQFIALFCLFLLCLVLRTTYEAFKKAGRANTKALFPVILTVMLLLWGSWFAMCPLDPHPFDTTVVGRWGGFGAFVLGWVLALTALVQLRGVEDIDHLVTTGLFSKIRHPMYTGFILWILGWGIYNGAGVSLIAGIVGIGNVLYWRGLEEADLESRYGDVYRVYRRKTWF